MTKKVPIVTLVELAKGRLENIRPAKDGWYSAQCPSPGHEDSNPSFNFCDTHYKCHGCGVKGDSVNFLTKLYNMPMAEAMQTVFGKGDGDYRKASPAQHNENKSWIYQDRNGQQVLRVNRYVSNGRKSYFQDVYSDGQWHRSNTNGHKVPERRPLYMLPRLFKSLGKLDSQDKQTQVWVVEGEKCADAVFSYFPKRLMTTWPGGAKGWDKADWTPLEGDNRKVLLLADRDEAGRQCMMAIGEHLRSKGTQVTMVLPEGEDGHDIADMQRDHKTDADVLEYVKKHKHVETDETLKDNVFYRLVGVNAEDKSLIFIQSNQETLVLRRNQLDQANCLLQLAPLEFWADYFESPKMASISTAQRQLLCSRFNLLARAGNQIDMNNIRGRGANLEKGAIVYNFGGHLLVDGILRRRDEA